MIDMSNAPYNASHLRYRYGVTPPAAARPLRPALDEGVFHHEETAAVLAVINEVANQLGIDNPRWCHVMEDALRNELRGLASREAVLCGLHERIAAQLFRQRAGPELHR